MTPVIRCQIRRDTYRDSVELMRVAAEVEALAGVTGAALLMATPANLALLAEAGLSTAPASAAGPADLIVAVSATDEGAAARALGRADEMLAGRAPVVASGAASAEPPRSIAAALGERPDANLAIVSTPGPYATAEALKARKRGLSVFLFSDNVPIEDEIELKRLAVARGRLVMGPDCGTAILDGVPLGFANAVRRGRVGLCGASGTGLQQVACLVDRLGEGVSQMIGVGGRDLDARVGGLMMLAGIERLARDAGTAVIVLVAKPPAPEVARRVLEAARASGKPVIASFLGGDPAVVGGTGVERAATLEDAARLAVTRARGGRPLRLPAPSRASGAPARRFAAGQRHVRGLYSGGTLAAEASLILGGAAGRGRDAGAGHTVVDLGADEYTVGRPHPMIDFRLRNERIVAAAEDATTAVILLDVVLGYGAHPDPAAALAPALAAARARAARGRRGLAVVASVCGTPTDPQGLERQERALAALGVTLAPSNAGAARLAADIARTGASRSGRSARR
jgi:FdrA protein